MKVYQYTSTYCRIVLLAYMCGLTHEFSAESCHPVLEFFCINTCILKTAIMCDTRIQCTYISRGCKTQQSFCYANQPCVIESVWSLNLHEGLASPTADGPGPEHSNSVFAFEYLSFPTSTMVPLGVVTSVYNAWGDIWPSLSPIDLHDIHGFYAAQYQGYILQSPFWDFRVRSMRHYYGFKTTSSHTPEKMARQADCPLGYKRHYVRCDNIDEPVLPNKICQWQIEQMNGDDAETVGGPWRYQFNTDEHRDRSIMWCAKCDKGSYESDRWCYMCDPGWYQPNAGRRNCFMCPRGKYQPWYYQEACENCPFGKTTLSIASKSINDCVDHPLCAPGTYSSTGRRTWMDEECPKCPMYTSSANAEIRVGSRIITLYSGATTCTQCSAGTAAPNNYNLDISYPASRNSMDAFSVQQVWEQLVYWSQYNIYLDYLHCDHCLSPKTSIAGQPCQCIPGYREHNVQLSPNRISAQCYPCEIHQFSISMGSISCEACPEGKQTLSIRATECVDCPANSWTHPFGMYGTEGCVCNEGYRGSVQQGVVVSCFRIPDCKKCAAGTYSAPQSAPPEPPPDPPCAHCPTDSWSVEASGFITDCTCNAGYVGLAGGPCTACAAGTYQMITDHLEVGQISARTCKECPENSNSAQASGAITDCACNVGYFWMFEQDRAAGACSACFWDEYKDYVSIDMNNQGCISCPPFSKSDRGSISESDCKCDIAYELNDHRSGKDDMCKPCAAGTFKDAVGDKCTPCPEHTYTIDMGSCDYAICGFDTVQRCICNAGFTGQDGGPCTACVAGKYKQFEGAHGCVECPGTSKSSVASTSIDSCTCNVGYAGRDCAICAAGKYQPYHWYPPTSPNSKCIDCITGSVSAAGSTTHLSCICTYGYYLSQQSPTRVCSVCEAGKYKDVVSSDLACTPCTDYSTSPPGSTNSTQCECNAGFHGNSELGCSKECPPGFAGSADTCVPCATGFYKGIYGSSACTKCFSTSFMDSGVVGQNTSALCKCPAGSVRNLDTCLPCGAGTFNSAANSSICHQCWVNTSGVCAPTMHTSTGASSCPGLCVVPAGWELVGSDGLRECAVNYYNEFDDAQSTASLTCTQCPEPESFTDRGGLTSVLQCVCRAGYWRPNASAVCAAAPAGTYKSGSGDESPEACPQYSTSAPASTSVAACQCNAGFTAHSETPDACQACAAGDFKHVVGDMACVTCPSLSVLPAGAEHNASNCQCEAGYSGAAGSCAVCEVGSFKSEVGASACTPCAQHATTAGTASVHIANCSCVSGYESSADGGPGGPDVPGGSCVSSCGPGTTRCVSDCAVACPQCEPGSYKDTLGPEACTPCAAPRNASRAGAPAAADCSCRAGELDLAVAQNTTVATVATVVSIGAYADVTTQAVAWNSTAEECWSAVFIPDGITALTIEVRRHAGAAPVFKCESAADCAWQKTQKNPQPLPGVCGGIGVHVAPPTPVNVSWFGGRVVQTAPAWTDAADLLAIRRLALPAALKAPLRPGDYIFADAWLATPPTLCMPCAPGMLCGEHISA